MKKYFIYITLMIVIALGTNTEIVAQGFGGPPDPGAPPSKANPPLGGGSAPVGGGTALLLSFGAAYAFSKYRKAIRQNEKEIPPTH